MALDYERLAQEFEAQDNEKIQSEESAPEIEILPVSSVEQNSTIADQSTFLTNVKFASVVGGVQQDILSKAKEKIASGEIVDKHAESLKNIADKALEVQAEQASLKVQEQDADNKVHKQEIRNKLIVLNAEAKRLEKEQKQLDKEQIADHKRRNKEAKWELYKDKLQKMHYTYVPNAFVLAMLLFFDGVRSFFDGLGTVSTAIVKALKWVFLIIAISIVLFSIPVTREWLINLLSGG